MCQGNAQQHNRSFLTAVTILQGNAAFAGPVLQLSGGAVADNLSFVGPKKCKKLWTRESIIGKA